MKSNYVYILIAIFAFVVSLYRSTVKAQKQQKAIPPPPPKAGYPANNRPTMTPEEFIESVLLNKQPQAPFSNPAPQAYTPPVDQLNQPLPVEEYQFDTELEIESELKQYEALSSKRSQQQVSANIPLEIKETNPIFTTSPLTEDVNLRKAVIWSEILGKPKGLLP